MKSQKKCNKCNNLKPLSEFYKRNGVKTGERIEYHSISQANRIMNTKHISACCLGKRKSTKGYYWKFKNQQNAIRP
ncbi:MAG: hypothetical protein DRI71_06645 [Bacteroidetes bacterium]|nr:MAG: hypothetical protein DRI71_06645 [Bacteroidota bacterium]